MDAWPEAAKSEFDEARGLADTELRTWTTEALTKMAQYHARTLAGGHKELDVLVAKAAKLLDRVPQADESKFREKMRKDGTAIATTQAQIAELLARMKKADPRIGEGQPAVVAEAGDEAAWQALQVSFREGKRMDDFCYFYTCLYVGLTLFHGATIRNDSDQGKAEKEKLKGVLGTMLKVKQMPCVLPASVRAMCAFLDVPWNPPGSSSTSSSSKDGAGNAADTVQLPPTRKGQTEEEPLPADKAGETLPNKEGETEKRPLASMEEGETQMPLPDTDGETQMPLPDKEGQKPLEDGEKPLEDKEEKKPLEHEAAGTEKKRPLASNAGETEKRTMLASRSFAAVKRRRA